MDSVAEQMVIVDNFLMSLGWGKYQEYVFWIWGAGWAADNMWFLLTTVMIAELGDYWDLSETMAGLIATFTYLGFLIGAYLWGYLSDKYGRIFSFRKTLLLSAVAAIGWTLSVNLAMLLVFCFIAGIGVGGDMGVDGVVFTEVCPANCRWRLSAMAGVCALGAVAVPLVAYIFVMASVPELWRCVTAVVWVSNFLFWVFRFYVFETPKYLVSIGDLQGASATLQRIAAINGKNETETELKQPVSLREDIELTKSCNGSRRPTWEQLDDPFMGETSTVFNAEQNKVDQSKQLKKLYSPKMRQTTLILNAIWFLTALSTSGFGMFIPAFMERSGHSSSKSGIYFSMVINQFVGIISIGIGTWMVTTRLGRKWTQSLGLSLAGVFLYVFLLATSYAYLVVSSTLFFFFLLMAFGAQYTITPESFPTDVRNTGLGICTLANRFAMIIAPIISGELLDSLGIDTGGYIAVVLYSVSLFVAGVLGGFLKETKDTNIEQGIDK